MCWSLRVYGTVLNNLLLRFCTNVTNWFHECCCCCCDCDGCFCDWCCCDGSELQAYETKEYNAEMLRELNAAESGSAGGGGGSGSGWDPCRTASYIPHHDYVIVDEIDANYLEISQRKIETEPYYLIVDRAQAEDILSVGYGNGACLVRPYKQADISVKYIVTIYAQQQYFHLFIRKIIGEELYGIGQEKPSERLFQSPSDIIDFYADHPLQCTNKQLTLNLYLRPIAI